MMKNIKKIATLGLAVFMSFQLMACDVQDSEKETNTGSKSSKIVELNYWHINSETFGGPTVTSIIEEFNDNHENIHVNEKFVPNTYQGIMQDLQADAAAGSSPDLLQIGWSYKEYFSNNFNYVPAEELFEQYGCAKDKDFVGNTYEDSIKNLAVNQEGTMVGFPYGLSVPVLYVNDDILSAAGIQKENLKTWSDVAKAAKTIKDKVGKWGLYIGEYSYTWEIQQILESNGANYIKDGKCGIDTPEAVQAYQMYADAVLKDKSALHTSVEEGKQAFVKGEIGMYFESVSYSNFITSSCACPVSVLAAPSWEGKEWRVPCGGNFLTVTSSTEEKKEATSELVKWLLMEDNMLAWDGGTGYIPPIKSAKDSELLKTNEITKMAYNCLPNAVPWASFPGNNGLKAEQILITTRDEILGGKISVADGLKKAQKEVNKLYK